MVLDPLFVNYVLIFCILVLLGWVVRLEIKLRKLLLGKDGKSLEGAIVKAGENIEKLNEFQKEVIAHFLNIEKRLARSIQAVWTVRFNPFRGTGEGGNQSFSTSFVSEDGKGVVLSSLYSRDRVSIFSKPLEKFGSRFELTEEEKEAVNEAKKNLKQ